MHLPISFCVSGFIAVTHSFFLVELASYWGLFPVFFRDERADLIPGVFHAVVARPRNLVGDIRVNLPDRFTFIAHVCAAVTDH